MTYLIYDDTFEGFLTAVFDAYALKLYPVRIQNVASKQSDIFAKRIDVVTDATRAARVWKKLTEQVSAQGLNQLRNCFLSELPEREVIMLSYIQHALASTQNIEQDYGHPCVLKINQISSMVGREKHRMEAFVRFQLTSDGIYYAVIEPDFNVVPLIIPHFKDRYADQQWIIYDKKRKYGVFYNLASVSLVTFDTVIKAKNSTQSIWVENEDLYQQLWKDYFRSANIKARNNRKLHLRHIPRRYWKYLTEKIY